MPDDPTVPADCRAMAKSDGNTVEYFPVVGNAMEIGHYKEPVGAVHTLKPCEAPWTSKCDAFARSTDMSTE